MQKTNIIGTGLSGLVGSRIVELLSDQFTFTDLSRKTGVDITDQQKVLEAIRASDAPVVLHLVAYTDVEGAEKEKDLKEQSAAWKINVEGTRNIVAACEQTGKKLLHFSTDMVFSGDQKSAEKYSETDATGAVGWYAKTKEEAEKVVLQSKIPWAMFRIAYPYRTHFEKKEYVRIFLWLLQEKRPIKAVADHFFTPTFIDDIPHALQVIIEQQLTGIFHITGGQSVSPYNAAMYIAKEFHLDTHLISKTTRAEFFKDRAPRGCNLSLSNDKISTLGVKMRDFEEGLKEIKMQLNNIKLKTFLSL